MELALPSVPPVLAELLETAGRTSLTASELERALAPTPELSHALVRLAHTFGRKGRAASVGEALNELGPRGIHGLVACLGAKKVLSIGEVRWLGLDEFWLASLRRAAAAYTIARTLRSPEALETFAIGFLLDIGLVLRVHADPAFAMLLAEVRSDVSPKRLRSERKQRGPSHDELGLRLCRRWGIPARIAVPIRYHHEPQTAPVAYQSTAFVAKAAEAIADLFTCHDVKAATMLAESALGAVGIETSRLGLVVDATADLVDDCAWAFGLDPMPEARFEEINDRAFSARTSQVREAGDEEALKRENERLVRENRALRDRLRRLEARVARGSIAPGRGSYADELAQSHVSSFAAERPTLSEERPFERDGSITPSRPSRPPTPHGAGTASFRPAIRKRTVS
jgi:HD-like signal output (HDOD) protein